MSVDNNNIEHKTENYDKLLGLSSHNYGHTNFVITDTLGHITRYKPLALVSYNSDQSPCMMSESYYLHVAPTSQYALYLASLYLGPDS